MFSVIDRLCNPIVSYPTLTYKDQLVLFGRNALTFNKFGLNFILFVKLSVQLLLVLVFLPVACVLYLLGYRFISLDITQIGSTHYLDAILSYDVVEKQTPKHKLILARSRYTETSSFIYDKFDKRVTFVYNPLVKFVMCPFFMNQWFNYNINPYDTIINDFTKQTKFYHEVINKYNERFSEPLIALSEEEKAKARAQLADFMDHERPIVTLHVRDSGFYKDTNKTARNADIQTYEKAISHLVEQGYTVVRLGGASSDDVSNMVEKFHPHFFDYAHSGINSNFLDAYLIEASTLFMGLASGPLSVAMLLRKKCCLVNYYCVSDCLLGNSDSVISFKKIRRIKDDSLLPFKDCLDMTETMLPASPKMKEAGFYLENSTPEEILETLKETLQDYDRPSELQKKAKSLFTYKHYNFNAAPNYSNTILQNYAEELSKL